jgi:hypothetical protein
VVGALRLYRRHIQMGPVLRAMEAMSPTFKSQLVCPGPRGRGHWDPALPRDYMGPNLEHASKGTYRSEAKTVHIYSLLSIAGQPSRPPAMVYTLPNADAARWQLNQQKRINEAFPTIGEAFQTMVIPLPDGRKWILPFLVHLDNQTPLATLHAQGIHGLRYDGAWSPQEVPMLYQCLRTCPNAYPSKGGALGQSNDPDALRVHYPGVARTCTTFVERLTGRQQQAWSDAEESWLQLLVERGVVWTAPFQALCANFCPPWPCRRLTSMCGTRSHVGCWWCGGWARRRGVVNPNAIQQLRAVIPAPAFWGAAIGNPGPRHPNQAPFHAQQAPEVAVLWGAVLPPPETEDDVWADPILPILVRLIRP